MRKLKSKRRQEAPKEPLSIDEIRWRLASWRREKSVNIFNIFRMREYFMIYFYIISDEKEFSSSDPLVNLIYEHNKKNRRI